MKEENNLDSLLKTFAKGSFIIFAGVIISKIVTYLYKIIIARNFGQEAYGLFSLAIMIFGIFIAIFSLGFQSGLLRYISLYRGRNEKEKIKSIFRFSLIVLLFVSFLGGILLFFFSDTISVNIFHTSKLTPFLQLFSIFVPVSVLAGTFHTIILAYEKVGWFSFIGNILSPVSQLIFLVLLIFMGLKTEAISLSYNLGFLVVLLVAFFICKHSIKEIFGKSNLEKKEKSEINKKLFSYSWPIVFFGLINILLAGIDSFVIGYLRGPSDVGIYNAAVPLSYFLLVAPGLFLQLFLPVITKEYSKKNIHLIRDLSKQLGKWIFILNLPILIIMTLFPGAVLNILFGSGYIQAENSLRLLSIGMFFYSIFQISENLLSMIGKSKTVLFNLIISCTLNIVLNLFLTPRYGITGAALSTMLSYIFWSLLSFFVSRHHTSINPLKWDLLKISLIAIIPAAILFYIRTFVVMNTFTILIIGFLFIILYFALIILTGCLDKNDLIVLKAVKNKISRKK